MDEQENNNASNSSKQSKTFNDELPFLILFAIATAAFTYLAGVFIIAIASNFLGWVVVLIAGIVIFYKTYVRFKSLACLILQQVLKCMNVHNDDEVVVITKEQKQLWQDFVKLNNNSPSVEKTINK